MGSDEQETARDIYQGYDEAGLEAQYNLRTSHLDRPAVYAEYTERSSNFRNDVAGYKEVSYGPAQRQQLDIFSAASPDAPIFVFFHGGYWRALDKSIFSFIAEPFYRDGWTSVLANYTLAPEITLDGIVEQAIQSISYLRRTYPNAKSIVISGHSAGGQLTLMNILNDASRISGEGPPIVAGIPISGVFELEPLRYTSINEFLHLDQSSAATNSPINLIKPSSVPLLVITGGNETLEFQGQSDRFVEDWQANGNRAERYSVDETNHFTVLRPFADPDSALRKKVLSFLASTL